MQTMDWQIFRKFNIYYFSYKIYLLFLHSNIMIINYDNTIQL
jgi:hypothetical protein